ncbi:MAG: hypothetical protein AB7K71_26010 [Polyangiaceae bacterium]
MLLFGSRAVSLHFPEFRTPKDWDILAHDDEVAELTKRLPQLDLGTPRSPKFVLAYDGAVVEITRTDHSAYWARVQEEFADEAVLNDPVLGSLHVAPAAYLLVSKYAGLIYHNAHWHKNMEDFLFLRERILEVPEKVRRLIPPSLDNSRAIFGADHERFATPRTCHPSAVGRGSPDRTHHRRLHELIALPGQPAVGDSAAWRAFPNLAEPVRIVRMREVLAEEATVIAAEDFRARGHGSPEEFEHEFVISALRELCTGCLPVGWRYFCVNHFREILALVPQGFLSELGDLADGRKVFPRGTGEALSCAPAPVAALHPPATGALRLPRVVGGETCSERRAASAQSCSPLPE